jgi:hypothetical protein
MLLGYFSANIQKKHRIHLGKQTMSGNTTRRNFLITSVAVAGTVVGACALQQKADTEGISADCVHLLK